MTEVKEYWCDDVPTLEDIKNAFKEVYPYKYIRISWCVKYSGNYSRLITWNITQEVSPEEYHKRYIPHVYGM